MNGGPGSTSGVFLRGANRGQTLVLIDGLRVGSSSVGATSLEAIPLDQIERIEILRGPASSLYGADAIGGVIQVFTKRAEGTAFVAERWPQATAPTTRATRAPACAGRWGRCSSRCKAGGTRSNGYNAIVNPANFSYNDDTRRLLDRERRRLNARPAVGAGAGGRRRSTSATASTTSSTAAPGFDDRTITTLEAWSVESRNRSASAGRRS